VRTLDLDPLQVMGAVPWRVDALWPREHLALLTAPRNRLPERFRSGLVRADLLTGRIAPLEPQGLLDSISRTMPRYFRAFGTDFGGQRLVTVPPLASGEPRFAASFKQDHYPALLAIVSARSAELLTPHPGWIWDLGLIEPDPSDPRSLLVGVAQNHDLDQRTVLFAVPADPSNGSLRVSFPPYELDVSSPSEAEYYTLLPRGSAAHLLIERDAVRVMFDDGKTVALAPRTGVPLQSADRGGLSAAEWQAAQKDLLGALLAAGRASRADDPSQLADAAATLQAYAARERLAPAQRGPALARAAVLLRRLGDESSALDLALRTQELEPDVPGHYRLVLDLLARLQRWPEAVALLDRASSLARDQDDVLRDLVVAGLATGQVDTVRSRLARLREPGRPNSVNQDALLLGLFALHEGDGDAAAAHFVKIENAGAAADVAFYRAIAEALRSTPDIAAAGAHLETARAGHGDGHYFPFKALEAYLAVLENRTPDAFPALDAELADQRRAARENVLDWYFVPWGEAFVARACLAAGDRVGYERHAAEARAARGAAGGVRRVLGEPGMRS
jgi:tetratricopeptide (TPR) repeat protein